MNSDIRKLVRSVPCDFCGAEIDKPCVSTITRKKGVRMSAHHAVRILKARIDAGLRTGEIRK